MKLVYVAGPYTDNSPRWLRLLRRLLLLPSVEERNVMRAMEHATKLRDAGFAVILPHLSHYWEQHYPAPYHTWIDMDIAILVRCDAFLRTPGPSSGASIEQARATIAHVPVFHTVEDVIAWGDSHAAGQPRPVR